jgi:hypothetical protein
MPLTSWLIQVACQNTYQNHMDACTNALQASTKQIGLLDTDSKIENYYTVKTKDFIANSTGSAAIDVAGGTYYVYKVYRNKAIDFKLPNMGIADSISNRIDLNSYSYTLNFSWKMPWK